MSRSIKKNKDKKISADRLQHRIARATDPSFQHAWKRPQRSFQEKITKNAVLDCGWGRLLFGHTFESNEKLKKALCEEVEGTRNISLYLNDPHVLLSLAPQELFLDPSHTYRIWFERYHHSQKTKPNFSIRRAEGSRDINKINEILLKRKMVPISNSFKTKDLKSKKLFYLMAEDIKSKNAIGAVLGIDHKEVFDDPSGGSSLWNLAVDPTSRNPGVGEALVRHLIEQFIARGRQYMDLSVMHDNHQAISLYEKLNFERVPVFCVKNKNAINEPLFTVTAMDDSINPYADLIIREARRRGIAVEIVDRGNAIFDLSFGGRTITCQESLSELTSAVAYIRCDHKQTTHRVLRAAGLKVPEQMRYSSKKGAETFLKKHKRIVVKPLRGEQGRGVSVDIRTIKNLHASIEEAKNFSSTVILEKFYPGRDLRVVVINNEVVAASIRTPPTILGDGQSTIRQLINKQNRRLLAATGGESRIPLDAETERCLQSLGKKYDSLLKSGEEIIVRKTANLHTGGTLHDVTDELHPELKRVSLAAANAIKIPVVGLDLIIKDITKPHYVFIEANERPGLANHEPQPTAEKFIDLLFPQTKVLEQDLPTAEIHS